MQRTRLLVLVATFAAVAAFVSITNGAASLSHNTPPPDQSDVSKTEDRTGPRGGYVVIGWNDLGMHCISPSFDKMAILPPYNNLMAQVIQKGNPPRIITSGVTVEYSIKGNTTVHNKTNFWQYVQPLFGVNPPEGIGLTGKGLAGLMDPVGDHFEAIGIPTVPKDDAFTFYPFQQGLLTVRDSYGSILATNDVTVPVSDELHCDYCHYANGPGAPGINTGSIDGNILAVHDLREGTNLAAATPVLCANCHADNALGLPGTPGVESMSLAMHAKHSSVPTQPGCYDCHPGPQTKCQRTNLEGMRPAGSNPRCESCHGSLQNVADTIRQGRQPWLQEPTCAQCHGNEFSTGSTLYRNARGHGGMYCASCHNSPHAWWPSMLALDNREPKKLQGSSSFLGHDHNCTACHTGTPSSSGGPHEGGGGDRARHRSSS